MLNCLVAGAGIAGSAAALALARAGHRVTLIDRRADPAEAGAGIQLGANAVKALSALGALEPVQHHAVTPEAVELRLPFSGRLAARMALGARHQQRYGAPYLHVHRADLHAALFDAARGHAQCSFIGGMAVTGASTGADGAELRLSDGSTRQADLVVGADGLRSTVRTSLFGAEQPRMTGMVAWRAVVPAHGLEDVVRPVASVWMGPDRHLVHYYVRRHELINLVGVVETPGETGDENWAGAGDPAAMRNAFKGWDDTLDLMLARVETCWRWPLYDRTPFRPWSRGRIVLAGDACHPMLPFLAQGAAMGLEDAVVLAACLKESRDGLSAALQRYEAKRFARTTRVQRTAAANAKRFHVKGRFNRLTVYGALMAASRLAPGALRNRFDWLYGFDPSAP